MIDLKDSLMTDILPGHLATAEVKALAYAVGRQIRQRRRRAYAQRWQRILPTRRPAKR